MSRSADTQSSRATHSRIDTLDALRGLACLSVVAFHLTYYGSTQYAEIEPGSFPWVYGSVGVQLFFMISGFVIFMTLDKTKQARDFIVSRFSRLYPAYWACLAITATVVAIFGLPGRETSWWELLVNLTMTQYWLGITPVDGVYWSLGVELFFYVAMLLAWRAGLLRGRRTEFFIAAWVLAAVVWGLLETSGVAWLFGTRVVFPWIHLFAAGICAYRIRKYGASWLSVTLIALVPVLQFVQTRDLLNAAIVTGCLALFLLATLTPWVNFLAWKPLLFLGAISYPVYLLHGNIGYVIQRQLTDLPTDVTALLATAVAVVLATAVTKLIEDPARVWLRERLGRGRTEGPRTTPVSDQLGSRT